MPFVEASAHSASPPHAYHSVVYQPAITPAASQLSMPEAAYVAAVPRLSTALSAPHIRAVYEVCGLTGPVLCKLCVLTCGTRAVW